MALNVSEQTEHLTFAIAETQTITIVPPYFANVMFLDISAPGLRLVDIKVGTTQVWKGWVDTTPVSLPFGKKGRGSGINGDNITVETNGATEIFVGVRQSS